MIFEGDFLKKNKNIKLKKAVVLKYKKDFNAPKVVAKGKGYVAEKILEKAAVSDIAVYEDKALVEELEKIDLGLNIPPYLYETVAQVLLFISDLDKKEEFKKYGKQQNKR